MKITSPVVINPAKLTHYLLVHRDKNDKSGFLNQVGYTLENWQELEADIRNLVLGNEAVFQGPAKTGGDLYKVQGPLRGWGMVTIWLLADEDAAFRFVTLFPAKKNSHEI
ncbi:MAG: hypothetical protein H7Y12_01350 [Sphingobacteriaceae bacterium]|nr:hypothetical protein [Cytophagaceae bacterium]